MVEPLPFSQFIRVKRIVEDPILNEKSLKEMSDKFLNRGYPKGLMRRHEMKVRTLDRDELLKKTKYERETEQDTINHYL